MKFSALWEAEQYGNLNATLENQRVSHLVIGLRCPSGTPITIAQLKAAMIRVNMMVAGKGRQELVDASLYDMAMITDYMNGYGMDFAGSDLSDQNIIIPIWRELEAGVSLSVQLRISTAANDVDVYAYAIDNGSFGTGLVYKTVTGSGIVASTKCVQAFIRDYGSSTGIAVQPDGEQKKTFPVALANIAMAMDSKIESEIAVGRIFSSAVPLNVVFTPTESVTVFTVEAA